MIVITGAAGFIGSCLVGHLNRAGYKDLVLVDAFDRPEKVANYQNKTFREKVERATFMDWFDANEQRVQFVFHIGARTDTTEFDKEIFDTLNVAYSKAIWNRCVEYGIPLVYASSAATYGLGEHGYADRHDIVDQLKPLNPYGESKNEFDRWALAQPKAPFFWAGLKFFNVYGPNEYHKGRMASVILHAFRQIRDTGMVKLFRSHNANYKDGEQLRDFIYVKDVVKVAEFLMEQRPKSGLFNLGTGNARTFLDLANATFSAMDKAPVIEFIDTPEDIRDKYQYYTQAEMEKMRSAGYTAPFTSLEEGVMDYVQNYLMTDQYF